MSTTRIVENLNIDKIKKHIADNNITLTELHSKMGVNSGYLSNVFKRGSISASMYKLLCAVLEVNESYFLITEEKEKTSKVNEDILIAMYKELREINYNLAQLVNALK